MYVVLFFFGCLAGATTVLFGFGGGFVVVPLLYALLRTINGPDNAVGHAAMHVAVATSTCVMIAGASMATLRHHRVRSVDWRQARPLLGYIAVGAAIGAGAAISLSGQWVRWAFAAYLAATILDSLLRSGFLARSEARLRRIPNGEAAVIGVAIGMIAAFLGVGGSVMTVPLMRRRGASMTQATAMANPLSLPIAVAGTATYILLAWGRTAALGSGYAGYVDLPAFVVLTMGSWIGITLTSPFIGRIPDGVHAKVYLTLLATVLLVMTTI